ncbi:hypothetical protein [Methylovulum psychrotolerans]|uniref:PBP domain-containing protein n=1 Tax=Methylovulum psychrotolerans TaxID=1704499 RepID=A0A1Z4BU29_9GAMM|nr:hypothetical protein [Methylovulum psychrotolerans]ASF44814.1 hypothetical protein CEK71_01340 [Methylovulum psychrotolerans]
MKKLSTSLAIAVSLFAGPHTAQALTPWTNGTPNLTVFISGAVALTNAYTQVVTTTLAASGTVDTFNDVDPVTGSKGSRWTAHYFTGNANLGSGLAGKKILLVRRTAGGSGYGVIPLNSNIPLEHLNIVGKPASAWIADGTQAWKQTISATNASTYLIKHISDGGSIAVDPAILLKPGTANYPDQQNELMTGLPEPGWPLTTIQIPTTGTSAFTIVPTGGLAYGVAVTLDLYKVLQAAQKRAGTLSSSVVVGNYNENDMPSLNHNLLASLIAGKIGSWDQIKIVDKTDSNKVKSLLDSSILADAGVTAPYKESTTGNNLTPVALGLRNNGAATSVIAYSVFLNYPATKNAFSPATKTPDSAVDEDASLPIVKEPIIVADTGTLLKDWQNGTNVLGFNNVADGSAYAKRWGIAVNSADRNNTVTVTGTGGDPWRYIRIDGYAPTLENIAAGGYPYWGEGVVLYRTSKYWDANWALKTKLMKTLADNLGSPTIIGAVTTTQPWGKTGAFATTADPRGFTASIPFASSSPVVPFSHKNNGTVHTELVPVADANAAGGLAVQMK